MNSSPVPSLEALLLKRLFERFGDDFISCDFQRHRSYNLLAGVLRENLKNIEEPICSIHVSHDWLVSNGYLPGKPGVFFIPYEGWFGILDRGSLIFTAGAPKDIGENVTCDTCGYILGIEEMVLAKRKDRVPNYPEWTSAYCSDACFQAAKEEYSTDLATDAQIQTALEDDTMQD